jgi:catechol 2,3-dioxygenase-like lactoylglutathione lyase family enzyme
MSQSSALIGPTLHHFGLTTAHLEEMLDWYAKVLGMITNFQSSWGTEAGASAGLCRRISAISPHGPVRSPVETSTPPPRAGTTEAPAIEMSALCKSCQ